MGKKKEFYGLILNILDTWKGTRFAMALNKDCPIVSITFNNWNYTDSLCSLYQMMFMTLF